MLCLIVTVSFVMCYCLFCQCQDHALATFNFLNSEKRYVAGAFIPPKYLEAYSGEQAFSTASAGGMDITGNMGDWLTEGSPGEGDEFISEEAKLGGMKALKDKFKLESNSERQEPKEPHDPNKYQN